MNSFLLFIAAAWLWLCLVMLPDNRMRCAVFAPILLPIGVVLDVLIWVLKKTQEQHLALGQFIGRFGHDKEGV